MSENWDIISGTAVEEKELDPRMEVRLYDCNLELSGNLAKMIRDCGMKQVAATLNPDGSRSIFFKLKE